MLADLVARLGALSGAETPSEIAEMKREVLDLLSRDQMSDAVQSASEAPKGAALQLLNCEDVRDHLTETHHLGCLAPLCALPATRLDYVMLTCQALLDLKEAHPGLGLGSSASKFRPHSGLEVAQSWAVLQSYGHLFGTFATERGVLYSLRTRPADKNAFLSVVNEELKAPCARVFERSSLFSVSTATAAARIEQWTDKPSKNIARKMLALWFDSHAPELQAIRWAFRRARQLVYNRMHAFLRVGSAMAPETYSQLIRELRTDTNIAFQREEIEESNITRLLSAFDQLHDETFFTAAPAARLVLTHLQQFKEWWATAQGDPPSRITALARRPSDWPTLDVPLPQLLVRLTLPLRSRNWLDTVDAWRTADPDSIWIDANFLVTPLRGQSRDSQAFSDALFDIYSGVPVNKATTYHLATQVLDHVGLDQRHLGAKPIAEFGLRLFESVLRPEFSALLSAARLASNDLSYALLARGSLDAARRINDAIPHLVSEDRQRELEAMAYLLETQQCPPNALVLTFTGDVLVLASNGDRLMQLDGLFAVISPTAITWHALEHKVRKQKGALKQLADIEGLLRVPVAELTTTRVPNGEVAACTIGCR